MQRLLSLSRRVFFDSGRKHSRAESLKEILLRKKHIQHSLPFSSLTIVKHKEAAPQQKVPQPKFSKSADRRSIFTETTTQPSGRTITRWILHLTALSVTMTATVDVGNISSNVDPKK